MKTKEEYLAEAKVQLDEWEADLAQLRDKAQDASEDVKDKVEEQWADLKTGAKDVIDRVKSMFG